MQTQEYKVDQSKIVAANREEAKQRNEGLKKDAAARLKRNAEWKKNNLR